MASRASSRYGQLFAGAVFGGAGAIAQQKRLVYFLM
jgi:hypothetical protein